jgi:hypothetical protein
VKRGLMSFLGVLLGLAAAILILGMFVHRPPECGEPAACGDDYLFPALPIAALVLLVPSVYSFILAKKGSTWGTFAGRMGLLVGLFALGTGVAKALQI